MLDANSNPVRVNLHTHTARCNHATGSVDDYCREAVKAGISILGFSDHSPFPDGEYGASRMAFSDLPDYLREIEEARVKYPQLTIFAGLELDYRPVLGRQFYSELIERFQLDYVLGGVHHLPAAEGRPAQHVTAERPMTVATLRAFVRQSIAFMELGLIEYLAHPDITALSLERWTPEVRAAYWDLLEAAASLHVPLEINAYGLRKKPVETPEGTRPPYPWLPFWELAAEHGSIEAVAGSDAHRPEDVWGNLDDAIAIGTRFGFAMQNYNTARRIIARRESRKK